MFTWCLTSFFVVFVFASTIVMFCNTFFFSPILLSLTTHLQQNNHKIVERISFMVVIFLNEHNSNDPFLWYNICWTKKTSFFLLFQLVFIRLYQWRQEKKWFSNVNTILYYHTTTSRSNNDKPTEKKMSRKWAICQIYAQFFISPTNLSSNSK